MKKDTYSTRELTGAPVFVPTSNKLKRVGKIHAFIFHPHERRIIGFTVKRPDVALMFHRADKVVPFDGFDIEEGQVRVNASQVASGPAVCKRFGVSWDECVVWRGMPLVSESGTPCGYVGDVEFSTGDGQVLSLTVDRGKSAEVLLGITAIPASMVRGFRFGVGAPLDAVSENEGPLGAIVVSDEALALKAQGGAAEKAGAASAKAAHALGKARSKLEPKQDAALQKADETLSKGAFALGSHLAKTKGMFASFKEEFNKASKSDDE